MILKDIIKAFSILAVRMLVPIVIHLLVNNGLKILSNLLLNTGFKLNFSLAEIARDEEDENYFEQSVIKDNDLAQQYVCGAINLVTLVLDFAAIGAAGYHEMNSPKSFTRMLADNNIMKKLLLVRGDVSSRSNR
ncbi:hypothetical protein [Rickettsiales endosymbiont of Stachyamoeba lipophora]|uniref:hypothetical protein n=1 Tax=Rickettsiales endosymbiont of Stachyamoeba lipophora TaxID=2486578 RepID=UPI000F65108E|nr:hypothetical protein [Rickettsiales endosymbiont of Stachyamoeba lipophora]